MKKLKFWWKQFCFSVGAQINAVLLLMLILFLSFSIYNHSLFNQFNARYQKEIDQYYSILELKNHFLQFKRVLRSLFHRKRIPRFTKDRTLVPI